MSVNIELKEKYKYQSTSFVLTRCKFISYQQTTMDFQEGQEFSVEDVETVVKSAIGVILNSTTYNPKKVNTWSNSIIDTTLKGLQSLNRPYKYCISVIIMQKNGAGLVSTISSFWDTQKDGYCKVTWENNTMHCIVSVFGLAVHIDSQIDFD